jgi:hypothetical protein
VTLFFLDFDRSFLQSVNTKITRLKHLQDDIIKRLIASALLSLTTLASVATQAQADPQKQPRQYSNTFAKCEAVIKVKAGIEAGRTVKGACTKMHMQTKDGNSGSYKITMNDGSALTFVVNGSTCRLMYRNPRVTAIHYQPTAMSALYAPISTSVPAPVDGCSQMFVWESEFSASVVGKDMDVYIRGAETGYEVYQGVTAPRETRRVKTDRYVRRRMNPQG